MADDQQIITWQIIYEHGPTSVSAWVPALPGCVATSPSYHETLQRILEAIQLHLDGMAEDGEELRLPAPAKAPLKLKPDSCG